MQSAARPSVGTIIRGKYRIEREIGVGGMGVVYEATNVRMNARVAIKMLLPEHLESSDIVARFEREARAAGQLQHRNAVRIIDVDVSESGLPYMVMELLHGHDLQIELYARKRLSPGDAVRWAVQACEAMSKAHERGIIHRDLKPSNLFLNEEADRTVQLKVLDFGISKVQTDDAHVTTTRAQMGTPLYMSPEQIRSAKLVDHRTDIWSLGVVLYELLVGEPPFTGSAASVGVAIVTDAPRSIRELAPDVPRELEAVVMKALAKDKDARFASMRALRDALAPFASTGPTTPLAKAASPRMASNASLAMAATVAASVVTASPPPPPRRAPLAATAIVVALVLLGGTVAWRVGAFGSSARAAGSATPSSTATALQSATTHVVLPAASTAPPTPSASTSAAKPVPHVATARASVAPSATAPAINPPRL